MSRSLLLWLVFFLICLGLGYPTLNRYDPRSTGGLSDTQTYYELAVHGPANADPQNRYRLLIPWLTRPITRVAKGRIGTWDPVFLGFLVVNSFFTAATASLLVSVAKPKNAALLAATLYLLNFETANIRLSGMVDSAEGCFLMAIVWSLLSGRLWMLPIWGVLGTLGKETFVPLAIVFTAAWWFFARPRKWAVLLPGLAGFVTFTILQSSISGHLIWPWQHAASVAAAGGHLTALRDNLFDRNLLYCIAWLLPLSLPRLRSLPVPWIAASAAAVVCDFALVTFHSSVAGAAARPFFSVAGPLLSLSAAKFLSGSSPETHAA